jgi:hypothetical protein
MANPLQAGFFAVVLLSTAASPCRRDQRRRAANFAAPLQKIAAEFEKDSGHRIVPSFGSTGKFYAQIKAGAPFEVLLAADDETPARWRRRATALPAAASPTLSASSCCGAGRRATSTTGASAARRLPAPRAAQIPGSRPTAQPASRCCRRLACSTHCSRGSSPPRTVPRPTSSSPPATPNWVSWRSRRCTRRQHRRRFGLDRAAGALPADSPGCRAARQGQGQAGRRSLAAVSARRQGPRRSSSPTVTRCEMNPADLAAVWLTLKLAATTTIRAAPGRHADRLVAGAHPALGERSDRAVVTLPLVLPPTVLGFYLLVLLGPDGIVRPAAGRRAGCSPCPSPSLASSSPR